MIHDHKKQEPQATQSSHLPGVQHRTWGPAPEATGGRGRGQARSGLSPLMRMLHWLLCGEQAPSSWAGRGEVLSQTWPHSVSSSIRPALAASLTLTREPSGQETPGETGEGYPHSPTPTGPNRQQFSSVPESGRKVYVCLCEYVCVLKARWEEKMTARQLTNSSNGVVYLGKQCPQPQQETLNAQVTQLQGRAQAWHTPTHADKCFLWPWPPQKTVPTTCQSTTRKSKGIEQTMELEQHVTMEGFTPVTPRHQGAAEPCRVHHWGARHSNHTTPL